MSVAPWRSVVRALARCEQAQGDLMPTPCWRFTGAVNSKVAGYGYIGWARGGGKTGNALLHRAVYDALVGPIPAGLDIDHLCRVRRCCNPDHLDPVTHRVNLLRGVGFNAVQAARTHCPEGHPYDLLEDGKRPCRRCSICRKAQRIARATAKTHRLAAGGAAE